MALIFDGEAVRFVADVNQGLLVFFDPGNEVLIGSKKLIFFARRAFGNADNWEFDFCFA